MVFQLNDDFIFNENFLVNNQKDNQIQIRCNLEFNLLTNLNQFMHIQLNNGSIHNISR